VWLYLNYSNIVYLKLDITTKAAGSAEGSADLEHNISSSILYFEMREQQTPLLFHSSHQCSGWSSHFYGLNMKISLKPRFVIFIIIIPFTSILSQKVNFGGVKIRLQSRLKMTPWLPNFKGRACKLDFPALHERNFSAYFTGCQIEEPEQSVKVDF